MKNTIILKLVLIVTVLMTASVVSAGTAIWTRATVDGPGNYGDPANWDPTEGVPSLTTGETFIGNNAAHEAEVQVTDAQVYGIGKTYLAYYPAAATLRITSTGSLSSPETTTGRLYLGFGQPCHVIIEAGGSLTHTYIAYAGLAAGSVGNIIDIAGTLDTSVGGKWDLTEGGSAQFNILDGGLFKLRTFADWGLRVPADKSVNFDVQGSGKITAPGDQMALAQALIDTGNFYGEGIVGNLVAVYDADLEETSIIVNPFPAAQDLYPGEGEDVPAADPLALSWTIPSAYDSNDVYCKVWIGTDPLALDEDPALAVPVYLSPVTVPDNGLNVTSAEIDGSVVDTYYWRVDLYIDSESDPGIIGKVVAFDTISDIPPVVSIETGDTMTWSDEAVSLVATITDDGASDLTSGWTAEPNGIDDPDLNIDIDIVTNGVKGPIVKITNTTGSMVSVTLTLKAEDVAGTGDASVTIDVYNDACDLTRNGLSEVKATDFNNDCITDVLDLAELAAEWLNDVTAATGPVPVL